MFRCCFGNLLGSQRHSMSQQNLVVREYEDMSYSIHNDNDNRYSNYNNNYNNNNLSNIVYTEPEYNDITDTNSILYEYTEPQDTAKPIEYDKVDALSYNSDAEMSDSDDEKYKYNGEAKNKPIYSQINKRHEQKQYKLDLNSLNVLLQLSLNEKKRLLTLLDLYYNEFQNSIQFLLQSEFMSFYDNKKNINEKLDNTILIENKKSAVAIIEYLNSMKSNEYRIKFINFINRL